MSTAEFDKELVALEAIASTAGKNAKRALLERFCGNHRMQDLLNATFNYKRKYYIKKWDDTQSNPSIPTDKHDELMQLLLDLESQKYRGAQAQSMVEYFLSSCSDLQKRWYSKVIQRDLKAGFGIDSAIECGFDIPLFEVQLAKDGNDCKKLPEMLKKSLSASPKLDGYRCLAIVDSESDSVTLYTRNGEVFENFPSVEKSLRTFIDKKHNSKYVFDGEVMSNDFNATQKSAFASKRRTVVGDVTYHIFDMIPYEEWDTDKFVTPAFERYNNLSILFQVAAPRLITEGISNLKAVERKLVHTKQDILDLEQLYISQGYEGVMTNPNIPYFRGKKSNTMLKFKTFVSMDCEVVGAYLGKPGTKYAETLGGFTVKQENGVTCDVGSGYDDSERDWLWKNQDQVIGRVMEVKYQNLSDEDKRMRFPIFTRWRVEKDKR